MRRDAKTLHTAGCASLWYRNWAALPKVDATEMPIGTLLMR